MSRPGSLEPTIVITILDSWVVSFAAVVEDRSFPNRSPLAVQGLTYSDVESGVSVQEELLIKKYGGLLPKARLLSNRGSRHFDSADWALSQAGECTGGTKKRPESLPPIQWQPEKQLYQQRPSRLKEGSS